MPVAEIRSSLIPEGFTRREGQRVVVAAHLSNIGIAQRENPGPPFAFWRDESKIPARRDEMGTRNQQPTVPTHFQLMEVWTQVLGCKPPGIDESFFDLGGHSLLLANMMEEVERVTGKYISLACFLEKPTIRHLADCLVKEASQDDVMLIQKGKEGIPPLFYFHGDVLGGGFYARALARRLGAHQPVYSVPPIQLTEDEMPTVEAIAHERVRAIRRHRAQGPYILGGFCIGALVAYETARQLTERGEIVEDVLLVNPQLAGKVLRSHLRIVQKLARRQGKDARATVADFMRGHRKLEQMRAVWNAPLRDKAEFVLRNGRKIVNRKSSHVLDGEPADTASPIPSERSEWLLSAFEWIATAHVPKPYPRRVRLFLTEDQERATPFLVRKWRKAAKDVEVQHIPGDHLTCITTFVDALGRKFRLELAKLNSGLSVLFGFPCLAEF